MAACISASAAAAGPDDPSCIERGSARGFVLTKILESRFLSSRRRSRLKLLARERTSRPRVLGSLGSMSPTSWPLVVRLRGAKKFSAFVETLFSARLTSTSRLAATPVAEHARLLPFPGFARVSRPRVEWAHQRRDFVSGVGVETGIS